MTVHTAPIHAARSGVLRRLVDGVQDSLRLLGARLFERLPLFGAAAVGGLLIALFTPGRSVATVALILGATAMVVCALALGLRTLRDDPSRSFLYARPLGAAAIFWGEFVAAMVTSALLGALAFLPGLIRSSEPSRSGTLVVFGALLAALPLAFLLTHTFSALAETRALWAGASGACVLGTVGLLFFFARELSGWSADRAIELFIATILIGLGVAAPLVAAHRRSARGRVDRSSCHRSFFGAYWLLVAVVMALSLGLVAVVGTTGPEITEPQRWVESPDPRWIAIQSQVPDSVPGLLNGLRDGVELHFVLDTETGSWTRLTSDAPMMLATHPWTGELVFSEDGDTLFWPASAQSGSLHEIVSLDLASRVSTRIPGPDVSPWGYWIGPDERLMIVWTADADRGPEGTGDVGSIDWSFQAFELGSTAPFTRWSWRSDPVRMGGIDAAFLGHPEVEPAGTGRALVRLLDRGSGAQFLVDLGAQSWETTAQFQLQSTQPEADDQTPRRQDDFFVRPQWDPSTPDLWVAQGRRLFRFDPGKSNGRVERESLVHAEPEGRQIADALVLEDRLLLLTVPADTPWAEHRSQELVVVSRDPGAQRQVVAQLAGNFHSFAVRIADDSLLLGPWGDAQRILRNGTEPTDNELLSVSEWSDARGLDLVDGIKPANWRFLGSERRLRRPFAFQDRSGQIFLPRGDQIQELHELFRRSTSDRSPAH